MDGRGRWLDNVFIERLWRSVKYELIYPRDFADGRQLGMALDSYFQFYNHSRPHQALGYRTPAEVFASRGMQPVVAGDWGSARAPPQTPGFSAFGQTDGFAVAEAFGLPYNQEASQEDRATQGCDPSASRGPD